MPQAGLATRNGTASAPEQLAWMFLAVDDFLRKDTFLQGIATRDPDILTPEVLDIAFGFERRIIEAVATDTGAGDGRGHGPQDRP